MRKYLKIMGIGLESIFLFIVIGALCTAITKNIYVDIMVEQFKNRGVYNEELSSSTVRVYEVFSDTEDRPAVTKRGNSVYPGNSLDIMVGLTSEIEIPLVRVFISFFAGGHAALVMDEFEDAQLTGSLSSWDIIETSGLIIEQEVLFSEKDYWGTSEPYENVIGLRVKNLTEEKRKKVLSTATSLIGDPYNYSFIANTKNTTYCSDLVMKSYASVGVNLNKDGFTTSVYDLVVSGETMISYYHHYDSDGVKSVYYLV